MQLQTDTSARILDAAQRLVQTRGYNGFSYADVAEHVGIRKASIHYHFPNKGDLGRELVARYRARFRRELARIGGGSGDTRRRLERYAGLYRAVLEDEGRMCLCGMMAADLVTLPEGVQEEVRGFFSENAAWLATVLGEGREAGALGFEGGPEAEAQLLLSSLEGAMLLARSHGGVPRFDAISHPALRRLGVV